MTNTQTPEPDYKPPEVLDSARIPPGKECQIWTGEEPRPCTNEADYVIVYDANADPSGGERVKRNVLACGSCWGIPEPDTVSEADL